MAVDKTWRGMQVRPNLVEGVVGGYPTLKHILNIFENFIKNFCGKILSHFQANSEKIQKYFAKNLYQKILYLYTKNNIEKVW